MIIAAYEDGYTLQYFESQAEGGEASGSDLACIFAPDGRLIIWIEPEIAVREYWPRVQEALLIWIDRDMRLQRGDFNV